jgi:hypothetical protein
LAFGPTGDIALEIKDETRSSKNQIVLVKQNQQAILSIDNLERVLMRKNVVATCGNATALHAEAHLMERDRDKLAHGLFR